METRRIGGDGGLDIQEMYSLSKRREARKADDKEENEEKRITQGAGAR